MPREMPPFGNYPDPDMERALAWFLSFIDPRDWRHRVEQIEAHLSSVHRSRAARLAADERGWMSNHSDRIAWYLYLVDKALHDCAKYEPTQGSRVIPIFARFGAHLQLLQGIGNVHQRVSRILTSDRAQPDSVLFELLVALLWARNGCEHVEFIPEKPPEQRPDIRAVKQGEEWFIECKRLQSSSLYSQNERDTWLAMWATLRNFLIETQSSVVFDIVFHVELASLPTDFLLKELAAKIRLVQLPCTLVDDSTWTVRAYSVDYDSIRAHLEKYYVRYPSEQIAELIGGRRDPNRGFTNVALGHFVSVGQGDGSNRFLDELVYATGAFWSCDAPDSISRKARDIRSRLASAVEQLPPSGKCAVHVGLETLDGPDVEIERLLRILNSVTTFDTVGKDLQWIYCHQFQSYAPPDQMFVIDETVHHFGRVGCAPEPLGFRALILPTDAHEQDGVHWLRKAP